MSTGITGGVLWQQRQFDIQPVPVSFTSAAGQGADSKSAHQRGIPLRAAATAGVFADPALVPDVVEREHVLRPGGLAVQHLSQLRFNLASEPRGENLATKFITQPQHIVLKKVPAQPAIRTAVGHRQAQAAAPAPPVTFSLVDEGLMAKARLLARHDIRHNRSSTSQESLVTSTESATTINQDGDGDKAAEREAEGAPRDASQGAYMSKPPGSHGGSWKKPSHGTSPVQSRRHNSHTIPGTLPREPKGYQSKGQPPPGKAPGKESFTRCTSCHSMLASHITTQRTLCPRCTKLAKDRQVASLVSDRQFKPIAESSGDKQTRPEDEIASLRRRLADLVGSIEASTEVSPDREVTKGKLVRQVQSRLHGGVLEDEEDTDTARRRQQSQTTQSTRKLYSLQQEVQRISTELGKGMSPEFRHTKKTRAMHRVASAHRAALRTIELVLRHRCDLSSTADRETANWQSQLSSLLQELTLCCAKLELCEVTPISVGHLEVADMKKKNRDGVTNDRQSHDIRSKSVTDARAPSKPGSQRPPMPRNSSASGTRAGTSQRSTQPSVANTGRPRTGVRALTRRNRAPSGVVALHRKFPASRRRNVAPASQVDRPTFTSTLRQHINTRRMQALEEQQRLREEEDAAKRAVASRQHFDKKQPSAHHLRRQTEQALLHQLAEANKAARHTAVSQRLLQRTKAGAVDMPHVTPVDRPNAQHGQQIYTLHDDLSAGVLGHDSGSAGDSDMADDVSSVADNASHNHVQTDSRRNDRLPANTSGPFVDQCDIADGKNWRVLGNEGAGPALGTFNPSRTHAYGEVERRLTSEKRDELSASSLADVSSADLSMTSSCAELDTLLQRLQSLEMDATAVRKRWISADYPDIRTCFVHTSAHNDCITQSPGQAYNASNTPHNAVPESASIAAAISQNAGHETMSSEAKTSVSPLPTGNSKPSAGLTPCAAGSRSSTQARTDNDGGGYGGGGVSFPRKPLRLHAKLPVTMAASVAVNRDRYAHNLRDHQPTLDMALTSKGKDVIGRVCDGLLNQALADVGCELEEFCDKMAFDLYNEEFQEGQETTSTDTTCTDTSQLSLSNLSELEST